jgi:hypothetical protein
VNEQKGPDDYPCVILGLRDVPDPDMVRLSVIEAIGPLAKLTMRDLEAGPQLVDIGTRAGELDQMKVMLWTMSEAAGRRTAEPMNPAVSEDRLDGVRDRSDALDLW